MAVFDELLVGGFGLFGESAFGVGEGVVGGLGAGSLLPARGAGGDLQAAQLDGRQYPLRRGRVVRSFASQDRLRTGLYGALGEASTVDVG